MWADEDWVLISALEHYSYCPRQCGLIHIERVYDENVFTLRGSRAHERVHSGESGDTVRGARIERGLPLWCDRLGISGVADVVEFHADDVPYPVEYKHGPRRQHRHDDLQLCAQALCLEEMLGRPVPLGAVYSVQSKRRREVVLSDALRRDTEAVIEQVRAMQRSGALPPPVDDARCPNCSLLDACAPSSLLAVSRKPEDVYRIGPEDDPESPESGQNRRAMAVAGSRESR
jgi:CRISPR-associated exonuclease Cas4